MFRVMKWTVPAVAFGLLMSLASVRAVADSTAPAKSETGSVSGTVVDKDGKPAANVLVRVIHPNAHGNHGAAKPADKQATRAERKAAQLADKPDKGTKSVPVASGKTDTDGKFTLNDVPAGEYTVIANVRGQGSARENIKVAAGETAKVELKLEYHEKKPAAPAETK